MIIEQVGKNEYQVEIECPECGAPGIAQCDAGGLKLLLSIGPPTCPDCTAVTQSSVAVTMN